MRPALFAFASAALFPGLCFAGPRFENALVLEWKSAIGEYESTREHADFLKARDPLFRFASPGPELLPGELAVYRDGLIINRDYLNAAASQLEKQGVPLEVLPTVLALKTLHIISHEMRHGMLHEIKTAKGISWRFSSIEEETIAFVDSVKVLRELEAKKPFLRNFRLPGADGRTLAEAASGGLAALGQWVSQHSETMSILSEPAKTWSSRLDEFAATEEENLAFIAKFKAMREDADRDLRGKIDDQLRRYHPAIVYQQRAQFYRDHAAVARDAVEFERVRDFYREQLAELTL